MQTPQNKQTSRVVTIDGVDYEIPTEQATAIINALIYAWDKLGKPDSPLTESGQKLMEVIIATWRDTYPAESEEWLAMRSEYKENELSLREQINTGRSLASYPAYIYYVMKKMFPEFDPVKRENCIKLVRRFPIFRMVNKV